ncbi:hypothetical protein GGR16_005153 [Chelatococcus caeni]|uniref:Uncharacterized protein n=1 Tax=Chelatococcus caeni TaxID=1348468 RepID=A0A840C9P4_9HYPH|nr:hypothetical protein [Chelatococcus caeni]
MTRKARSGAGRRFSANTVRSRAGCGQKPNGLRGSVRRRDWSFRRSHWNGDSQQNLPLHPQHGLRRIRPPLPWRQHHIHHAACPLRGHHSSVAEPSARRAIGWHRLKRTGIPKRPEHRGSLPVKYEGSPAASVTTYSKTVDCCRLTKSSAGTCREGRHSCETDKGIRVCGSQAAKAWAGRRCCPSVSWHRWRLCAGHLDQLSSWVSAKGRPCRGR